MTDPTVPATPVVLIRISGDQVMVNNSEVEHDGTQSLYEVAVHAAAERVAVPLNRPVRAEASDGTSTTRLVIHPDGHASDIEAVPLAAADVPATPAPLAAPRGRRVLVGAAIAGSLAVGVLAGTAFNRPSPQSTPSPSPATVTTTVTVTPTPTATATPPRAPVRRTVRVKASSTGKQLNFRVSLKSGPTPTRVVLKATKKGRPTIRREVAMKKRSLLITIKKLPAGTYRWEVFVPDAKTVTGKARVKDSKKKVTEPKKSKR